MLESREMSEPDPRRRRRLIAAGATLAVVIAVGGTIAALTGGGGHRPMPAASTRPATRSVRVSPPVAPTADERAAAIAGVRAAGVPLYRTPGRSGNAVALTFDDGPGPYSRTTIDTLTHYGMQATFFLCGTSIERYPSEPALETSVGAVGDHTWSHPDLTTLSPGAMRLQISRTKALVEKASGAPDQLFRPPYGAHGPAVDATVSGLGMIEVLWSLDAGDSSGAGWKAILTRIEATIGPGDIVILHENRGQTQKVINRLLPWMEKHGLRSVSVPELLVMDPPSAAYLRKEAGRGARVPMGTG